MGKVKVLMSLQNLGWGKCNFKGKL